MKCNYCTKPLNKTDEYGKFPDGPALCRPSENKTIIHIHLKDIFVCEECIQDSRSIMEASEVLDFYIYLTPKLKADMEKQKEEYDRI